MIEAELFTRACRAWFARCQKENWIPDQPSESGSEVDLETGVVTLRNCNGVLAVYQYDADRDRLRWIEKEVQA